MDFLVLMVPERAPPSNVSWVPEKKDSGEITVLGMNPTTQRRKLFEQVGVQFQESKYQDGILVRELCEVTASLYQNPSDYHKLLKDLGLAEKEKSFVKDLSGGERQRLFIVLALIPTPRLVFLDELTTGLDAHARREVWKHLNMLKQNGLSILLTSHYMDEIEALCDEICILKRGNKVFHGTVQKALEESPYEKLEDAYLWYTNEEVAENESL